MCYSADMLWLWIFTLLTCLSNIHTFELSSEEIDRLLANASRGGVFTHEPPTHREGYREPYWEGGHWVFDKTRYAWLSTRIQHQWRHKLDQQKYATPSTNKFCNPVCLRIYLNYGPVCAFYYQVKKYKPDFEWHERKGYNTFSSLCELERENCIHPRTPCIVCEISTLDLKKIKMVPVKEKSVRSKHRHPSLKEQNTGKELEGRRQQPTALTNPFCNPWLCRPSDHGGDGPVCAVFLRERRDNPSVEQRGFRTFDSYCRVERENCLHPGTPSSTKTLCQLNTTESAIEFSSSNASTGYLRIGEDIITLENATTTTINDINTVSTAEKSRLIAREGNAPSNVTKSGNGKNGNGKNGNGKNGNGKNGNGKNGNGNGDDNSSGDENGKNGNGRGRGGHYVFTYPYYSGRKTRRGQETTTAGTRQYCAGGCKSYDFGPVCAVFLKEERQDSPVVKTGYRTFSNYCQMVAVNCAKPGQVGGKLSKPLSKRDAVRRGRGSVCCVGVISGLCLHEFGAGLLVRMLPVVEESRGYDFQDPENADRWRGLFVNALRKVLEQVHPTLTAEESALQYVESLCLRLLAMLCAAPSPLTVQDVEERVARTFPTPLDKWALADARDAVTQRRRRLQLPLDKVHHMLLKEVLLYKIDMSVSIFMTAILEYVSADILKLAGNFVKKISQKSGYETVTSRDIKTAMCADKVLMDMFYQDSELALAAGAGGVGERRRGSLTYAELVRDLLTDEKHFLRELHLIIRVFKDELEKILDKDSKDIAAIFGNIVDIYELTVTLLGNLEDACEMSQDSPTPYIASCFEELAEVEEFRAYLRYANIVTSRESRDALQRIVDDPELSERLDTAGHGFRLAVKYYLPKLLLAPVGHVFLYHNYVLALLQIATHQEDRESFKQVECNLHPIKKQLMKALGNGPKMEATLRMATRARRQLAVEKCNELARIVDNWDDKDIGQCCNEFIREDTLSKIGPGKRIAERRAYLFDGLLLLCKPITSLVGVNSSNSGAGGAQQLKLKEKLHVRKLELVDRPDTEEGRHMVELWPRVGPAVVLACASAAEKRRWMCDLVMLNTKPMLDRSLDSILVDLERRHPLQLPPATLYRFAVPDAPDNIVLEDHPHSPHKLIKGATLLKLVERLTYHVHADLNLVRTFLTTYRSFCSPSELLSLLIERFHIPEPGEVYDAVRPAENIESVAHSDIEKISKNTVREDWKRYRKEFQQPVKFRVINVLRHWVDQHFYDFERDPALLARLRQFLLSVDGKPMKKWVQSVVKTLDRKSAQSAEEALCGVSHVFDRAPPPVLRHLTDPPRYSWHPLALHPLELARQLTLLELQLYRQVKPSELVGAVWTKKDKEKTSPNLLKLIKHTTNFTHWMAKWIVESENLDERVGVLCRLIEVACALRDLNNFNGVLAVGSACGLSSVHRLKATFDKVPPRLIAQLKQFQLLNADHFRQYKEQLRSINPPCVPFCGIYLTNILHIEEGNLDYLPNSELINFSKWRKVAEITGEIQQYQNQPYCLTVEPATRAFLESLDPFPGLDENEITNYLYAKSLEIEPRPPNNKTIPRAPRRYPELSLKPVKWWAKRAHDQPAVGNNTSNDDTISVTSQLSPTNSAWDGASVHSLPVHDDHRGSKSDSLVSPRLERCGAHTLSQLSLFDKTIGGLFTHPHTRAKESAKNEPPSPRDRHSPRHDRQASAGLPHVGGERKPLSPRGAIVDAELFYCSQERVPPLLPRNSTTLPATTAACSQPGTCHHQHQHQPPSGACSQPGDDERPPALPRRDPNNSSSSEPPEPPDRPLPSPKHDALRMPAMSPKRSPAPPPPPSPLAASAAATDRVSAFRFPASPPAAPVAASTPAPHTPPHPAASCGTPPPLPPRRRRDSAAPPTPAHQPAPAPSGAPSSGGSSNSGGPPPLPPRPAPAPSLLRPAHSTILQRRHTQSTGTASAPRLPPKPPPALAPRP